MSDFEQNRPYTLAMTVLPTSSAPAPKRPHQTGPPCRIASAEVAGERAAYARHHIRATCRAIYHVAPMRSQRFHAQAKMRPRCWRRPRCVMSDCRPAQSPKNRSHPGRAGFSYMQRSRQYILCHPPVGLPGKALCHGTAADLYACRREVAAFPRRTVRPVMLGSSAATASTSVADGKLCSRMMVLPHVEDLTRLIRTAPFRNHQRPACRDARRFVMPCPDHPVGKPRELDTVPARDSAGRRGAKRGQMCVYLTRHPPERCVKATRFWTPSGAARRRDAGDSSTAPGQSVLPRLRTELSDDGTLCSRRACNPGHGLAPSKIAP